MKPKLAVSIVIVALFASPSGKLASDRVTSLVLSIENKIGETRLADIPRGAKVLEPNVTIEINGVKISGQCPNARCDESFEILDASKNSIARPPSRYNGLKLPSLYRQSKLSRKMYSFSLCAPPTG